MRVPFERLESNAVGAAEKNGLLFRRVGNTHYTRVLTLPMQTSSGVPMAKRTFV